MFSRARARVLVSKVVRRPGSGEIARFLAGEGAAVRERLAAFELAPPGNAQAAALIQEMVDGTEALDGRAVADHAAGRGRSR
jgi:hypothetical protein